MARSVFNGSKHLSHDDNDDIRLGLGPGKECLATTVAQISFSSNDSTSLTNRDRIMCFIRDVQSDSFHIHIYTHSGHHLIWKETLLEDFGYVDSREYHTFKCQSQDIKARFHDVREGSEFVRELRAQFRLMDVNGSKKLHAERKAAELAEKERKRLKKAIAKESKKHNGKPIVRLTFGDPKNFKHTKHISTICLDEEDINDIFRKAGIDKDRLKSRVTSRMLKEALAEEKSMHAKSPVEVPELIVPETPPKRVNKKKRAPPLPHKTEDFSKTEAYEKIVLGDKYEAKEKRNVLSLIKPKQKNAHVPVAPPIDGFEKYIAEQRDKATNIHCGEVKKRPIEVENRLNGLADILRKIRPSIHGDEDEDSSDNDDFVEEWE